MLMGFRLHQKLKLINVAFAYVICILGNILQKRNRWKLLLTNVIWWRHLHPKFCL